jgi:FkbM family methyltransferase
VNFVVENISRKARSAWVNRPVEIKPHLVAAFGESLESITVADIGACEGLSSIQYHKNGIGSRFHLFEPLIMNKVIIDENLRDFKMVDMSDVYWFALGDVEANVPFYISSGDFPGVDDWNVGNKSSSLFKPKEYLKEHTWIDFKKGWVKSKPLDSFKIAPDFIHMDVQGAEMLVINGGTKTFKSAKVVFCEYANIELYSGQPMKGELDAWFLSNGFRIAAEYPNNDKWGDVLYVR